MPKQKFTRKGKEYAIFQNAFTCDGTHNNFICSRGQTNHMCFDFVGKNGDVYALMKDYQLAAKNWGADIELKVNQNEAVIAEDFKAQM